jgi:hypothetical protein
LIELNRIDKGNFAGHGKLSKDEVKNVFDFCRNFDLSSTNEESDFVFDVRSGVIHWLDKENKEICSSLYFDLINGEVKIEVAKDSEWNKSLAFEKWFDVISQAQKKD